MEEWGSGNIGYFHISTIPQSPRPVAAAPREKRPPRLCGAATFHGYVCVFLHQVNPLWMIHSRACATLYQKVKGFKQLVLTTFFMGNGEWVMGNGREEGREGNGEWGSGG